MNQEELEQQGYEFRVVEQDTTDAKADADNYFRVAVFYHGRKLGTRSELTQERALERAVKLANRHQRNPEEADLYTAM